MASFTLDDIRAAAEQKYGSTDIQVGDQVVRLVNPLRLPKEKRDALTGIQKELDADDSDGSVDQVAIIQNALRLVSEQEHLGNLLVDSIGDDLAVLAQVFEMYGKSTQVGEASASAA